jgi:hypothetical protein
MRRQRDPITDLRRAIDALPVATREAMIDGIRSNPIVVGAYTDGDGGICPMLAAHRHGGRTTLLAFARSWDTFAGSRRVRRATRRELAVLESHLTASLLGSEDVDLAGAIAEHESLKRRRDVDRATGSPTGVAPAAQTDGRVFADIVARRLRPARRADAERALARLDQHELAARARAKQPA